MLMYRLKAGTLTLKNNIPYAITGGNGQFANRIIVPGNVLNMNVTGQVYRLVK